MSLQTYYLTIQPDSACYHLTILSLYEIQITTKIDLSHFTVVIQIDIMSYMDCFSHCSDVFTTTLFIHSSHTGLFQSP